MENPPPNRRNLAPSFTDGLLVEILRRLPVRSLCRFKCISRSWRYLISESVHRKKLPHTLTGFFYHSSNLERFPSWAHHFTNVTGKGAPFIFPSFSFLPFPGDEVFLLDSCNGLLLCRCFEPSPCDGDGIGPFHYVVCNPATEKWVMLPDGSWVAGERRTARLGFDPTVSSHFHVIEYVEDENDCGWGSTTSPPTRSTPPCSRCSASPPPGSSSRVERWRRGGAAAAERRCDGGRVEPWGR